MPKVRAGGTDRWSNRAAVATEDYKMGISNPRQDWQSATAGAAENHKTATMASLTAGSFAKGVAKAGNEKWQRKARGIGADRFAPGVASAKSDYAQGVAPYLAAIESLTLPPRGPKGDPRNIQRVVSVVSALRAVKMGK